MRPMIWNLWAAGAPVAARSLRGSDLVSNGIGPALGPGNVREDVPLSGSGASSRTFLQRSSGDSLATPEVTSPFPFRWAHLLKHYDPEEERAAQSSLVPADSRGSCEERTPAFPSWSPPQTRPRQPEDPFFLRGRGGDDVSSASSWTPSWTETSSSFSVPSEADSFSSTREPGGTAGPRVAGPSSQHSGGQTRLPGDGLGDRGFAFRRTNEPVPRGSVRGTDHDGRPRPSRRTSGVRDHREANWDLIADPRDPTGNRYIPAWEVDGSMDPVMMRILRSWGPPQPTWRDLGLSGPEEIRGTT